ncbi:hypothetical protein [Rhizobium binxianense]
MTDSASEAKMPQVSEAARFLLRPNDPDDRRSPGKEEGRGTQAEEALRRLPASNPPHTGHFQIKNCSQLAFAISGWSRL